MTIDRKRVAEFKTWLAENCPDCYCKVRAQDGMAYSAYQTAFRAAYRKTIVVYELRGGNPTDAFLIKLYWS